VVGRYDADIADTLHRRDVAMTTTFSLSMSYKYSGCVIASGTISDSRVGCSGSRYPMKT